MRKKNEKIYGEKIKMFKADSIVDMKGNSLMSEIFIEVFKKKVMTSLGIKEEFLGKEIVIKKKYEWIKL